MAIDPGSFDLRTPARAIRSTFEPSGHGMRIAGVDADGEVVLYTWRPNQGTTWLFENLTEAIA